MINEKIVKIYRYRAVLRDMSIRQFKLSFAGLKLGIWWLIITPLVLALSINFVFTQVLKINIANYTLFVLAGITPWFFFTSSLQEATTCLIVNSAFMRQSVSPREFIPISVVIANLFSFSISLVFLVPLFVIFNPCVLKVLVLLPIVMLMQCMFISGLGFIFAIANVFFRDLSKLLPTLFMIWFWVTPVFYSSEALSIKYRWIYILNPLTYYISSYQNILFGGKAVPPGNLSLLFFIGVLSFMSGFFIFIKTELSLLKKL